MIEFIDIDELTVPLEPKRARQEDLGAVLSDVESMLPAGHPYKDNDRITWSHEGVHGINGRIKNELCGPTQEGIYILQGKAATLPSPRIKLSNVANAVPRELRGDIYQLYLVDQQRYWNDRPLYVFNEWSAYYAGSLYREQHKIKQRGESCRFMMEAMLYSLCCIKAAEYPKNLRRFTIWLASSTISLYKASENLEGNKHYWDKLKEHEIWNEFVQEGYLQQVWVDYYVKDLVIGW